MRLPLVLAAAIASLPALAQTPPGSKPDNGFFRPSADPALTSIRPAPPPAPPQPAKAPPARAFEAAEEIRKAEEARALDALMDRSEREHERARAEAAAIATAPASAVAAGAPASAMPPAAPTEPTRY